MCGITGVVGVRNDTNVNHLISLMTESLQHRGPDAGGVWVEKNVGLGHRRLSIIDLTAAANQPLIDESGRYVLVYNGEIYNYLETRKILENRYSFKTNSDTEVLLYAYIEWQEKCLDRLDGMFAFSIYDRADESLFIARDRLGIKPFYYHHDEGIFLFSSEIRSILNADILPRKIDKSSLVNYLASQTVHAPKTMIEGVHQLEPGFWGILKGGILSLNQYWKLGNVTGFIDSSLGDTRKRIRELFFTAIEKRLVADVKLGAFLSGGIDSAAIVAAMSELSGSKIDTYNISFAEEEFDESSHAELVAKKYGTSHYRIELSPAELLETLPEILQSLDSPSVDGANTYMVSKAVKSKGVSVALSGLGGDELFCGYSNFKKFQKLQKNAWVWNMPLALRRFVGGGVANHFSNRNYHRMIDVLSTESSTIEEVYPYLRTLLSLNQVNQIISTKVGSIDFFDQLKSDDNYLSKLPSLSRMSIAEIKLYTQDVLLKDSDQMSMAHGLELRVPFFDYRLIEYVLSVPDKFKQPTYQKQLLVDSIAPLIPNEVVFKKKQGFSFPWEEWMRNELKSFCEKNLRQLSQRVFFNSDEILGKWQGFIDNKPLVIWSEIWNLVVLEEWLTINKVEI